MTKSKNENNANKLQTLATIQPRSKLIAPCPKTLKYFSLRRTARLFAVADALMASFLLISRYFIVTRIVTFPIFQLLSTSFYILLSCFGIFQVFTVRASCCVMNVDTNMCFYCFLGEYKIIPSIPTSLPTCNDFEFGLNTNFGITNF